MPASPIRMLMPLADAAKRRGVRILHLNIGQPDLETPLPLRSSLQRLTPPVIAYTPSGGTAEFLSYLQGYYLRLDISLGMEEIVATAGASEALLFALIACAGPGDEAIVAEPFYTNYHAFAAMAGVALIPVTCRGEDGFHLPPREVWEKAVTPRTRAVILCNPNNPTGTVYTADELADLAEFCRKHDLFLISDEVYREYAYDGRQVISALSLPGMADRVVVVDSLSKRYSACGLRLGALITRNRAVHQACLHMAQGRLSAPGLAQLAALGAAELGPDYHAGVNAEFQKRRDALYEGLSGIPGVFLRQPEGAFYFIARLPVADSEDFARWLLNDFQRGGATVMVAPAAGFYATPGLGRSEIRIAYVLCEKDLREAVAILAGALPAYQAYASRPHAAHPRAAEPDPDFHSPAEG
jgi:aspartate aminotransferase